MLSRPLEISDYALIGDCHSAALIGRDGSIDWVCFHRFDQRAAFNRLLDEERGGFFALKPHGSWRSARRYRPDSNVLETTFVTDGGVVVVTDAFLTSKGESQSDLPPMQLVRLLRCTEGQVTLDIEIQPRFDYGLTVPFLDAAESRVVAWGGSDALLIDSDVGLRIGEPVRAHASLHLTAGQQRFIALTSTVPHRLRLPIVEREEALTRLEATDAFWRGWASRCTYRGPYRSVVVRSALALKALTNTPTGAIVAAATTSLPEDIGGERNWDYRFTWLRDAEMHIEALYRLGYPEEGHAFVEWVRRATACRGDGVQVLYGAGGERLLAEMELSHLSGYRGSWPVRIGNAAATQFQLDVYGHVLSLVGRFHSRGGALDPPLRRLLTEVVDIIERRWREPDRGIWEVRGAPRHFVWSKAMACLGIERAAQALQDEPPHWWRLAQAIREDVTTHGLHPDGWYRRAYEEDETDAALARLGTSGFEPPGSPRMLATLQRIDATLASGPLLLRYATPDGLAGSEGHFTAASFWAAHAWVQAGFIEEGAARFEALLSYANDVGLFSEEIERGSRRQLGNFPQSLSHTGLVVAAVALAEHESNEPLEP